MTICDSPTRVVMKRDASTDSLSSSADRHNSSDSKQRSHQKSMRTAPPQPGGSGSMDSDVSVGIMASGLAWVKGNRERRRRMYLQHQAEQQLRKIAEAECPTQQQLLLQQMSSARQTQQSQSCSSGLSAADQQASDRINCKQVVSSSDDKSTSDSNHNHQQKSQADPSNRYFAHSTSGSSREFEEDEADDYNNYTRIGTTNQSKSGEGASGQLTQLLHLQAQQSNSSHEDETNEDKDCSAPEVRVEMSLGDDSEQSPFVLTQEQMNAIASKVLPQGISFCKWRRLYSLNRDGDSFSGCLRIIERAQRTLLVVRTTRGAIFGGYADAQWRPGDMHNAKFYGSAQACLFRFLDNVSTKTTPRATSDRIESKRKKKLGRLEVYKWTGKNRYIQLCDTAHKMFAFGGGGDDGAFGLSVEEDFQTGSTGPCDTFDNEPLCDQDTFDVVDVEFWEFLTGVF